MSQDMQLTLILLYLMRGHRLFRLERKYGKIRSGARCSRAETMTVRRSAYAQYVL